MNNPIIDIENFSFRYPYSEKTIGFNGKIEINKGETVLITGPSGSGKTTLLYGLKGLIPETIFGKLQGKVQYLGKQTSSLTPFDQMSIGFLFQNPDAQMINRTVRQELALGMENLRFHQSKMLRRIDEFAIKFDIEDLLDKEVHHLSGGEKQKVALISVLLMEPELILFDEPTAFLDPDSAESFIKTFKNIATSKTIVIIEHNRIYLQNLVDRVITVDAQSNINEIDLKNTVWMKNFPTLEHIPIGKIVMDVSDISFAYPKSKQILKSIKFQLHSGEVLSITGKNGAGKSTLLRILAQHLRADCEEIDYYPMNSKRSSKSGRNSKRSNEIALLLQNPENHFLFNSVEEEIPSTKIIGEFPYLHPRSKRDMTSYLNEFFAGLEKRNPFTLSEGEKRRLSLGILWSLDRNIYLLDEPTFGQDEENVILLIKMIDTMRRRGKSFIIVSHDLAFIQAVSSKIMNLVKGELVEVNIEK